MCSQAVRLTALLFNRLTLAPAAVTAIAATSSAAAAPAGAEAATAAAAATAASFPVVAASAVRAHSAAEAAAATPGHFRFSSRLFSVVQQQQQQQHGAQQQQQQSHSAAAQHETLKHSKENSSSASGLPTDAEIEAKLLHLVETTPIVLFLKGRPEAPLCGFSAQALLLLDAAGAEEFTFVDCSVLPQQQQQQQQKRMQLRQAVRRVFDWHTLPLLVVKGSVVGGSDIMRQLHQQGQLAPLLQQAAAPAAAAAAPAAAADADSHGKLREL
ncbi:hypothetical protein Esti_001263 [Eimeria stiedai]